MFVFREDLQFYAHNGATPTPTYLRKSMIGTSQTIADLLQFYHANALGTEASRRSRTVEIRFIVDFTSEVRKPTLGLGQFLASVDCILIMAIMIVRMISMIPCG